MSRTADITVIGAGIVGLATAVSLTERHPRARVVVLDKEARIATHQTGHNSGVIHSGIYYKPGSFKARLCVEGARLMTEFCDAHGIGYERCGKVIVATEEEEIPRLNMLHERGTANGVPGLKLVSGDEVREWEPHVRAVRGMLSPATGIVDYTQVADKMAALITQRGAEVVTGAGVRSIRRDGGLLTVETEAGPVSTRHLINCAGLHSDRVAALMGIRPEVQIIPFRGEYYMLKPERRSLVRGLIYPVPDPRFPFLGVHFTRTVHGDVEAGPNAVLALAREGYTMGTVRPAEALRTLTYRGFWNMGRRYWKMGVYEVYRSVSKGAFVASLQRLVPGIQASDIAPGGAGVRAQAVSPDGSLVDDFKISVTDGAIHVLNAPSPAATASLAIGRHIAGLAAETFKL
ncbi:MAG TPA: L-2-hydroxyglutarate oxidase [Methylomirabilota bacterium]